MILPHSGTLFIVEKFEIPFKYNVSKRIFCVRTGIRDNCFESILMKFIHSYNVFWSHLPFVPPIFSSSTLVLLPQYCYLFFLKDYWVILVLPDIYGCKVIYWARLTFQDFIGEGTLRSLQQLYQLPPSFQ